MTRFILPLLLATTAAAPALADTPAREIRFTRGQVSYSATISERAGVETIVGRELDTGRSFSLKVAGGHVSGTYDGQPVAYDVADAVPADAEATKLSAR